MDAKWSDDAFLDSLRQQADPQADRAVARLIAEGGDRAVGYLFRVLRANDDPIPADAPEPFREFMEETRELPPGLDLDRVQRGGDVFLRHAVSAATVLLASSLPRGYAATCLCEVLSISRDLQRHPFERLMGVVQLLVNISNPGSFQPHGRAILTAQKLRLLHAGVRTMVPRFRPHYREKFGEPVNHEDMLATIMGFSYLVIDGLRRLKLPLTEQEAEDFYYLWRVFALLMGIHPQGRPHDASLIPATVPEAGVFYDSYVRRNDAPARENPYGVVLTLDNIRMMERLLPKTLRWVGFRYAPRICMTELMTPEELARVGMRPIAGHRVIQGLCSMTLSVVQGAMSHLPFSSRLASLMFQDMIDTDRGGEVTFSVPVTVYGLRGSAME
jgi:hypothetical protein